MGFNRISVPSMPISSTIKIKRTTLATETQYAYPNGKHECSMDFVWSQMYTLDINRVCYHLDSLEHSPFEMQNSMFSMFRHSDRCIGSFRDSTIELPHFGTIAKHM
jgi:hypothetical protein